jgi:Fanconi anemia group M protein
LRQAGWVLVVTADVHERASGMPELLEALGAHVEVRALTRGDYILGPETVVERKTVRDLHVSIAAGRFWHQMRKIRAAGRWPYLVIEGQSIFHGWVPPNGVRGICLAVTDLGVTIIRTEDTGDTAEWLFRLASRRRQGAIRDRPPYAQLPRSVTARPAQAALTAAPGVSLVTAQRVLDHFGSLHRIGEASVDELQAVSGVGIKRATSIASLIHDPWTAAGPL